MSHPKSKIVKCLFDDEKFRNLLEPDLMVNLSTVNTNLHTKRAFTPKSHPKKTKSMDLKQSLSANSRQNNEFLQKKNALIVERSQVLSKENRLLTKKTETKKF